jgi:NAD(P)-dependent dehydrogenase (short-subunit alcohol dehydrogenase family)
MPDSSEFLNSIFGLAGKRAVVTGAASTIAVEVAVCLARSGAKVAVLDGDEGACSAVISAIEGAGGEGLTILANPLNQEQMRSAKSALVEAFGGLDVLVNTAGSDPLRDWSGPLFASEYLAAAWDVLDQAFFAPLECVFALGELLVEGKGGAIVNVSSSEAQRLTKGLMSYSAATAGIEQLTRWLASELGRRYGGKVRVNAIAPWPTPVGQRPDGASFPRRTPAADIASTVLWLCAPGTSYVTGQVIPVAG